jgi:hypothetical protein
MSHIQQSQMITTREERTRVMNLTEKKDMKSKVYNHIMSILNESNISKKSVKQKSYRFRKLTAFSIERRSQQRELSTENLKIIEEWFNVSNIIIEFMIKTSNQKKRVKRLFYTWRDCFVMKMTNIKITDLMKHSIVLKSKFKSAKDKILRYISKKREFANQIFSQMKEADIITRMNSDWDARTKFSSKKKRSDQLKMIHNYISLNDCTVKMQYSVHKIEKVINILMKLKFKIFFFTNAIWEYWTIITKKENVYKTEFVSSHEQWVYLRMSMRLTESSHTYAQFTNLVFESLSIIKEFKTQEIIIEDHEDATFASFVNDHSETETTYEALFKFLHEHYFFRAVFELIYLSSKKIIAFIEELNMIDFIEESNELRSSIKHRIKIMKWLIFINRVELNDFLWLTSFLRQFISERANHVLIMKKAYMIQIFAKSTRVKSKAKVKECDEDLIKISKKKKIKSDVTTIRRQWVERLNEKFIWDASQQASFDHVKKSITENAMTAAIHESQYHLTTNASKRVTEACLFQLFEELSDTVMTSQLKNKFKIIMFMSFRLNDVEIRYSNIERECLTIVNALAEVRWLIVNSKWKIICYIDHHVLNFIMTKKSNEYERIAISQDKLSEYDIKIIHRLVSNSMIDIAIELSRLSTKLTTKYRTVDQERSHFMKKDEDNEENDESDWIERTIRKREEAITETIMSKDWIRTTHEKHLEAEFEAEEWKKYDWCSLFKNMIAYLRHELKEIEKLSRQERKIVINQSFKYILASEKSLLMYHEKNDRKSSCLTKDQIDSILEYLHDEHEHYSHVIILNRMKDETYWSIKTQDVIVWCKSCSVCQLNANKHLTTAIRHVLIFELMSMIKLNFLSSS